MLIFGFPDGVHIPLFKTVMGMVYFYLIITEFDMFKLFIEWQLSGKEEGFLVRKRFSYFNFILNLFMYPTSLLLVYDDSMYYNTRSTLFSLTLIIGYISLALRFEEFPFIGVYVKVLRHVVIKSLQLLPIFLIIFTGFLVAFFVRSGYKSPSLSYARIEDISSELQITNFNNSQFLNIMVLFNMLSGDLPVDKLGLGTDLTVQNAGNYFLVFTFMFLCIFIFYNLFVGLATYAIDKNIKDSNYHSLQCQIHYIIFIEELAFKTNMKLRKQFVWVTKHFLSPLSGELVKKGTLNKSFLKECLEELKKYPKRFLAFTVLYIIYFFIFFIPYITWLATYTYTVNFQFGMLLIAYLVADVVCFLLLLNSLISIF